MLYQSVCDERITKFYNAVNSYAVHDRCVPYSYGNTVAVVEHGKRVCNVDQYRIALHRHTLKIGQWAIQVIDTGSNKVPSLVIRDSAILWPIHAHCVFQNFQNPKFWDYLPMTNAVDHEARSIRRSYCCTRQLSWKVWFQRTIDEQYNTIRHTWPSCSSHLHSRTLWMILGMFSRQRTNSAHFVAPRELEDQSNIWHWELVEQKRFLISVVSSFFFKSLPLV